MIARNLFFLFWFSVCCYCLNAQNLIVNPGFENTTQNADKPDYWHPRATTLQYHHIETDPANVYSGSKCAKFNNTGTTSQSCYYYSNYDIAGVTGNYPGVGTEEVYEFSIKYKTDSAFIGKGISIQLFLCDGNNIVGNYNMEPVTSSTWSTLRIRGKVQGVTNRIAAGINYDGQGIAWVDDVQLIKVSDPLCKNGSFETDIAAPADKPDYYMPRSATSSYHHVETSLLNSYLGYNAAMFNNTGASDSCYYYGPCNADGMTNNYISVCPGDSYTISGFGRVDTDFTGNNGVKLSIIFWNNSTFVSRVDSPYIKSTIWTKMTLDGTVPAGANTMSYSAEYNGQNKAWIDEIRLIPKNLVKNSSFETDLSSPSDRPDYWQARSATSSYHHVETALAYEGSKCAQFNNNSGTNTDCYYYGPADTASSAVQCMDVIPGETYTFSAWGKVDPAFSGPGLKVSIIFNNDTTFAGRVDSPRQVPANWTKLSVQATVPATGVNKMYYSIEYNGCNKAWFDRAELYKTNPWYYQEASTSSLEPLTFTPPSKVTYAAMQDNFYAYHVQMESSYHAGDGCWDKGYGVVTSDYPAGHPLVRASANAAIGYLHAYGKIGNSYLNSSPQLSDQIASDRGRAALTWLLSQQNANGSFSWWNADPPTSSGGAEMYETGLAGVALIKGYEFFNDSRYLDASTAVCNYFLNSVPNANANANFNAFAVMALVANYKFTTNSAYLNHALDYMNTIISFQLDSGMLADMHNEYTSYHGIITQSMVELVNVMPDSNPKKEVIRQALYKALNHSRRSQNNSPYPTVGALLKHPINGGIWYCENTTMAVAEAYKLLNIPITDSLDTLAAGTEYFVKDTVQGFGFAALGIMLDDYYP